MQGDTASFFSFMQAALGEHVFADESPQKLSEKTSLLHWEYKKRASFKAKARIPRKICWFVDFIRHLSSATDDKMLFSQSFSSAFCVLLDLSRYIRAERAKLTL